jgi:hypothetical protein
MDNKELPEKDKKGERSDSDIEEVANQWFSLVTALGVHVSGQEQS